MAYKYNCNLELVKKELENPNKTLKSICKELEYKYSWVSHHLRLLGVDNSKRKVPYISKEKCFELYKEYSTGKSVTVLSKENNITKETIWKYFKKYKLSLRRFYVPQGINHTFFQNIDTEEKAYLLGFFAADGTINKHGNGMTILLQAGDVEILDYFNKAFKTNKKYYLYPAKQSTHKDRLKLEISSGINKEILITKGFPCNKTYEMFALPNSYMESSLYKHFIRGYFDGDGSIVLSNKNNRTIKFKITSSNYKFLMFCKEEFEKLGCYNIKIEERKNNFAKTLYIQNKPSICLLYHYLYDNSKFYLKRKYLKMKSVAQLVGNNFQKIDSKIGEPNWLNYCRNTEVTN